MPDRSRRRLLRLLSTSIGIFLAGCNTTNTQSHTSTSTVTPAATVTTTPTPAEIVTQTPTATATATPVPDHPTEAEIPEDLQLKVVQKVNEETRNEKQQIEIELEDQNGLTLEKIGGAYLENQEEKHEKAAQLQNPRKTGENTVKAELELSSKHVQPGTTNTIGLKVQDQQGNTATIEQKYQVKPTPWKIHLEDQTGALKLRENRYKTSRQWDTITNQLTEEEFLTNKGPEKGDTYNYAEGSIYWNDIAHVGAKYDLLTEKVDQELENVPEDASTEEKIEALVKGTHQGILADESIQSSSQAYEDFFTHERKYALEEFGWDTDKFYASTIRGNKGNHEIIFIAYEDDHGDWQLRYHEPFNDDGIQKWEDSFYGEPEDMVYADNSGNLAVDAFNHSKLFKLGTSDNPASPNTPSDIHYLPASSLLSFADATRNDSEPKTRSTVFEKSYLEELETMRNNENFDRETLETLWETGRKIFTVYNGLEEDDYVGIRGKPGEEEFYRMDEDGYEEVVDNPKANIEQVATGSITPEDTKNNRQATA